MGWVHSRPLEPAPKGGDLYYLAVCSKGLLSRVALADVAGHGQAVSATAATLRDLVRKHMNALDQGVLMQEMNEARTASIGEEFAHAAPRITRHGRPSLAVGGERLSRRVVGFR
jgi:hypothetical protein